LKPGTVKTLFLYVRNEANAPVTLSLAASNWSPPSAANYFALNWNYANQTLNAGATIAASLTLTVYPDAAGLTDFSFDTVITVAR
jgi:hypothetical protein